MYLVLFNYNSQTEPFFLKILNLFRDEIDHVLARKEELEKELTDLLAERDTLSESLEMSNTSITTLERKHREQELMIR